MTHPLAKLTAALALLAVPTLASAQTPTIQTSIEAAPGASSGFTLDARLGLSASVVGDANAPHIINRDDCDHIKGQTLPKIRITWSYTNYPTSITTQPSYSIKLAPPGSSCDESSFSWTTSDKDGGCVSVQDKKTIPIGANLQPSTTTDVNLATLLGTSTCDTMGDVTAKLIFIVDDASGLSSTPVSVSMTFTIDTLAAAPHTLTAVSAGNTNLKLSWTPVDDTITTRSRVYWSKVKFPASAPTQATSKSETLTGTSYQITKLTNGETYYVAVTSVDDYDNESAAAKVQSASPVPVQDMWQYYKANGGSAEGGYYGCSAGPGRAPAHGAWPMVGLLLLLAGGLMVRRSALSLRAARTQRRGRHGAARLGAAALALAASASLAAPAHAESPRTMSLDARFTYYSPNIDNEFSKTTGATPFADIMKDQALQWGASIDWRIWHGFGELCAGFSVGYWTQTGNSRGYDGTASQDETELMIVPITVDVVYRFNFLAEKYNFPLVPYAKGGLAYGLWWAMDGTGETSSYTGPDNKVYTGSGGVAGLHGTIGLRLLLDVFEPKAARGFDLEMGVNHSYLFVEYQRLSLTNFGDPKALDLSSDLVVFGIAFDL